MDPHMGCLGVLALPLLLAARRAEALFERIERWAAEKKAGARDG